MSRPLPPFCLPMSLQQAKTPNNNNNSRFVVVEKDNKNNSVVDVVGGGKTQEQKEVDLRQAAELLFSAMIRPVELCVELAETAGSAKRVRDVIEAAQEHASINPAGYIRRAIEQMWVLPGSSGAKLKGRPAAPPVGETPVGPLERLRIAQHDAELRRKYGTS